MEQLALFTPFAPPPLQVAAQAQDQIGWHNFLLGQIASAWSPLQQQHLDSIGSNHTSDIWVSNVVTHLLFHSLWVFCNQVVHDQTLVDCAQVAEADLSATIQLQFDLGSQDLLCSEQHCVDNHSIASLLHTPFPNCQIELAQITFTLTTLGNNNLWQ